MNKRKVDQLKSILNFNYLKIEEIDNNIQLIKEQQLHYNNILFFLEREIELKIFLKSNLISEANKILNIIKLHYKRKP